MKIQPNKKSVSPEERERTLKELKIRRGELPSQEEEITGLKSVSSALIGGETADELLAAQSLNHALRLFCQTLPEDKALEVAAVYPEWQPNKQYKINEIVRFGKNQDGEPQIFKIMQAHTSQADWKPDKVPAMFKKLGFTQTGTPVWVQPLGAHDAYQINDVVSHNGKTYKSTAANNVWAPGVYGWVVIPDPAATVRGGGK